MSKHRTFTPEFKAQIILQVHSGAKTNAEVCREHSFHASSVSQWKSILIRNAPKLFQGTSNPTPEQVLLINSQMEAIDELTKRNEFLEKYIEMNGVRRKKRHVCAEEKRRIIAQVEQSPLPKRTSLRGLLISRSTYYSWKKSQHSWTERRKPKYESQVYRDAIFSIIHAPPKLYGFNRTSWKLADVSEVMKRKGLGIGKNYMRKIIRNEGYTFRKARKILTSTDPDYQEKLAKIKRILSRLLSDEKFFSVDEYGPFAVKVQGGRSLTAPGVYNTYPQIQTSKGSIVVTGALELSTNQMTYFYSEKKNSGEIIKLLELLRTKYAAEQRLFISWDCASWHMSKRVFKRIKEMNKERDKPGICLAPLPACAQFLNVIESVFSGMSKAIICNSNYASVDECKSAIDRYFKERNEFYKAHPKRAGNKLWGKERVKPEFNEGNNCKDIRYVGY